MKPHGTYDTAFQAGAASRDAEVDRLGSELDDCGESLAQVKVKNEVLVAEIERLKTVPMRYRRLAFNAKLQDENDNLRNQVTLLRDAVAKAAAHVRPTCNDLYEELMQAIDATEPKP